MRSVTAQTCTAFEVIVVDDGSTDNTAELAGRFAEADPRFRLLRQENRGLANARNTGMAAAKAPFVAPLDADDLWGADYLERMLALLKARPSAPFAFAYSLQIDESDRVLSALRWPAAPRHDFAGMLSLNSVGNGSACVMRRDLVLAAGGYDETLRERAAQGAEDWKLVLQLARLGPPALVPRHLVAYRQSPSAMSKARPEVQMRAVEAVLDDVARFWPDVSPQALRNARTMMIAWLLPAFVRRRQRGKFIVFAMRGYVLNPLWFADRNIRTIHLLRLRLLGGWLADGPRRRRARLTAIGDWTDQGERPFAYMRQDADQL